MSVAEALVAQPVVLVEQRQLGAGVWVFASHDHPHLCGPACVGEAGEQTGQLGDLGMLAQRAVGLDRRGPGPSRQRVDRGLDRVGHREPDRELGPHTMLAQRPDMGEEVLGAARAVGADQDRAAVPVGIRDLRERIVQDRDVVGRGVRARIARPQPTGQRLTGVVQPAQQRVIAKPALEGRRRGLLVRMRLDQAGVQVEHQTRQHTPGSPRRRQTSAGILALQPQPIPRHRTGPAQRSKQ